MSRRRMITAAMGAALAAATTMAVALPAAAAPSPVAPHTPDAGALGAQWTATERGPQKYPGMHIDWDVPIRMSDGVVLKANVYRPADASGRPVDVKTPVIVNMTPYTKLVSAIASAALNQPPLAQPAIDIANAINLSGTPVSGLGDLIKAVSGGGLRTFTVDPKLIESGYTQVVADVRGTGFSQGTWQVLQGREQQDTVETVDWAAEQPWSDGKVGMSGVSYSAINQVQAASRRPAALKAIFPVEPGGDILRDVVAPGGALGIGFMPMWLAAVNGLKWVPNVQSMLNGTFDWKWLADRQKDPLTFMNLLWAALTVPTVKDIPPDLQKLLDPNSSLRKDLVLQPQNIDTPTMVYGGWHDIFTNSEPRIYNAIPLPAGQKQLIMGDTYHLDPGSTMGQPGNPPGLDVLQRAWFDHWLKGIDNGIQTYGPITSWQQGNGWTTLERFPRPGMTYHRMYLGAQASGTAPYATHDGSLTPAAVPGTVSLTVAPGLTTLCSRDASQETIGVTAVLDVCGKDSRIAERDALTFTSAPVTAPTEISGPVNLHLNTVLDATDGYWTATLNDVAPDGTSTVLTSGQLTSSLRAVDEAKSSRSANGDYTDPVHILSLASRKPIVPGQPTTLDVGLTATDAVLKPGHRLRVDVFASNFPKGMMLRPLLNESGLKPQHLVLDPSAPSFVNVPLSKPIG
ncbi:CocE/NonD family hydrolase [Speluncibacter jeojiensis]|uniref:CocE/NonD family hydrolase n=1 Tax=Speluncibacter jeojiensis TaxID=2710754 RepID=A0A9X4M7N4_9ACTN|nr:CocE/NonD family hydrolase [Corynebacteriales bacterium D3-21]